MHTNKFMPIVLQSPRPGLAEPDDQKAALPYALFSRIFSVSLALLGKLVPSHHAALE